MDHAIDEIQGYGETVPTVRPVSPYPFGPISKGSSRNLTMRPVLNDEIVVAFRTHTWNEGAELTARRLFGAAAGLRFCVLANQANGPLPIPAQFETIPYTEDFADYGLPEFPVGVSLWYNGDYPLYCLRRAFPDAAYFVMSEHDAVVNVNLAALVATLSAHAIDFVASGITPSTADWTWDYTLTRFYPTKFACFMPFMIISARAIDALHHKRLAILAETDKITDGDDWPFCEGFVISTLMNDAAFKTESLENLVDLPYYHCWPPISVTSPLNGRPNAINHPVLSGQSFITKLLTDDVVNGAVYPGGVIEDPIYRDCLNDIVVALHWRYRALGRNYELGRLHEFAADAGIALPPLCVNLAHGKPATQSSICKFSIGTTPEDDASRGNSARASGLAFHTGYEPNPWWQCDLKQPTSIRRIVLFNRIDNRERCVRLSILISDDTAIWTLVAAKLDQELFGGADGKPFVCVLHSSVTSRYVRIQAIGEGFLHLDQIELYS